MYNIQSIKRLVLKGVKTLPIILGFISVAVFLASISLKYSDPLYQSKSRIKLELENLSYYRTNFQRDFTALTKKLDIITETELISSKELITNTLKKLNFQVSYFRPGQIKSVEMLNESPFLVNDFTITDESIYDKEVFLKITSDSTYEIRFTPEEEGAIYYMGSFDKRLIAPKFELVINKNEALLNEKPNLNLLSDYVFKIRSFEKLYKEEILPNLIVTTTEEDLPVIDIYFKSKVPEKSVAFANALANNYIDDYIHNHSMAAKKNLVFINRQLETIGKKLKEAESKVEQYRLENNVLNSRFEIEVDLKKISQIQVQLSNLQMKEAALDSLSNYMSQKNVFELDLAPNFNTFTDLLSTEIIMEIKHLQAEKKDLMLKYTNQEPQLNIIDEQMEELYTYLKESVENAKNDIRIKREGIERTISNAKNNLTDWPTKEKELNILDREFTHYEKMYDFLAEKKIETSIASTSDLAFHRIIEKATIPKNPVSPKGNFLLIFAGFLGTIIGAVIVVLIKFLNKKIETKEDLEKLSVFPISGVVRNIKKVSPEKRKEEFMSLVSSLINSNKIVKNQIVVLSSTISKEGKTFIAENMAKCLADLNWKTLLIDFNLRRAGSQLESEYNNDSLGVSNLVGNRSLLRKAIQEKVIGDADFLPSGDNIDYPLSIVNHSDLKPIMDTLRYEYDIIIIDTSAVSYNQDAISLMKMANQNFYVVRAEFTPQTIVNTAELIQDQYQMKNIQLILNGLHPAYNYDGSLIGSRFEYIEKSSFRQKIRRYYGKYIKRI